MWKRSSYFKKKLEKSLIEDSEDFELFNIPNREAFDYFNEYDFNSSSSSDTSDNDGSSDKCEIKTGEFKHIKLPIQEIDVDTMETTFLHGKLYFNNENIVYGNKLRQESSKYAKYRKLFKLTGKVLQELNYSDQGQINSEINRKSTS